MRTIAKDILMICKGHYDKEKHKNLDEALDAYYRKHYDVSKKHIPFMTHNLIYNLWLQDCVREFLTPEKKNEFIFYVLSEESFEEKNYLGKNIYGDKPAKDYYDVMYYRIIRWLSCMQVRDEDGKILIDLSDYEGNVI